MLSRRGRRRSGHHAHLVDEALRGRGMAGQLMQRAAEHLRASGRKAVPVCSYAAAWFKKAPGICGRAGGSLKYTVRAPRRHELAPGRAYCRQASQEALNSFVPASLLRFLQTWFFLLRDTSFWYVNTPDPLRSKLTRESPFTLHNSSWGVSVTQAPGFAGHGKPWKGILPVSLSRGIEKICRLHHLPCGP